MNDLIDQAATLAPGTTLHATRHARAKAAAATQRSAELFFATDAQGLSPQERQLAAWYVCRLSHADTLAAQHEQTPECRAAPAIVRDAIAQDDIKRLPPGRLRAILVFTRELTLEPIRGNQAAVNALRAAGVATADVVTLAQLIGFLTYQLRVVSGLQALKTLGDPT